MSTVTLLTRTVTGVDADGNDVYTTATMAIPNAIVWPRTSSELVQGQDLVIIGLNLIVPPTVTIRPTDQIQVDNDVYNVDGEPGEWTNPFTGWNPGTHVALTKVSG